MLIDALKAFCPVNMATAANNGDWVPMRLDRKLVILFFKNAAGSGTEDPAITVTQASDSAGAGAKALNIPAGRSFTKTDADLATVGFVAGAPATNTLTVASSAQKQGIWIIELETADLDVAGGFTHVRASVADVGSTSQIGCLVYLYVPALESLRV